MSENPYESPVSVSIATFRKRNIQLYPLVEYVADRATTDAVTLAVFGFVPVTIVSLLYGVMDWRLDGTILIVLALYLAWTFIETHRSRAKNRRHNLRLTSSFEREFTDNCLLPFYVILGYVDDTLTEQLVRASMLVGSFIASGLLCNYLRKMDFIAQYDVYYVLYLTLGAVIILMFIAIVIDRIRLVLSLNKDAET